MDQVKQDATFDNDLFDRKRYADMCEKLIESHPEGRGACTIAVNSPWGVGKSTFMWMWINELNKANKALLAQDEKTIEGKKPVLSIYYNAWENDFCDSALAPLLYSICAMVEKSKDNGWLLPENDNLLTEFISSCGGLLTSLLYFSITADNKFAPAVGAVGQVATKGLLGIFKRYMLKDVEEPEPDSIGAAYDKQLEDRNQFRNALSQLAEKFGGVYIFIDELDRCKPSFAIDTLEVIKHYFDISGLTFIFGVDMVQLGHAIGGRYGNRMDTGGYLTKFFDHQVRLPMPTAKQMITSEATKIPCYNNELLEPLTLVFQMCEVTPREVPGIIRRANTIWGIKFHNFYTDDSFMPYLLIVALLGMKVKRADMYSNFLNGRFTRTTVSWPHKYSNILDDMAFISEQCPKLSVNVAEDCAHRSASIRKEPGCYSVPVYIRFCMLLAKDAPTDVHLGDHIQSILELTL